MQLNDVESGNRKLEMPQETPSLGDICLAAVARADYHVCGFGLDIISQVWVIIVDRSGKHYK
jgi:hypothetical protein